MSSDSGERRFWLNKMNDPIGSRLCFWYRERSFAKFLLIIIVPFFRSMSSIQVHTAHQGERQYKQKHTINFCLLISARIDKTDKFLPRKRSGMVLDSFNGEIPLNGLSGGNRYQHQTGTRR